MKDLKEFIPLWKYIKKEKYRIFIAAIIIIISSILSVTYGYLNGAALEAITNLDIKSSVFYLVLYFLVSVIASSFLYFQGTKMFRKIEINLSKQLTNIIFAKTLDLPAVAFEEKTSGELINKITQDTEALSYTFSDIFEMIINIFCSLIILVYIFFNSIIVGIEIVIFMGIMIIVTRIYNPKLKKMNEDIKVENDKYVSGINESIRGIREIKSLGIKDNIFKNTRNMIDKIFIMRKNQMTFETNYEMVTDILRCILEIGVFITCAILIYYGKSNITFFVAMTYYVYRYGWIINRLATISKKFEKLKVSLKRINEIIENTLYQDEQFGNLVVEKCEGIIKFRNVDFGYKRDLNILNKFNLELNPNQKIAIVGKSGQGKSTLFNLITRMFDPKKGTIYIDKYNIKDISEYSLRKLVSVIRQDPFIFNCSIKDNFKLINPNISLKEIRKYTSLAYIDDYIMSLPKKYNTIIGEGGVNLSGGQKQRLAIARTLAKQGKIILFDEATSALDNESQTFIKKLIDGLVKNHTIVIIAHRLSTIIDADIIYVVDKGKVVASGKHKDLLKNNKIYQGLYSLEN